MIESDRFRVMAGAGSGWRRGGSLHRKRPTDGKGKAAPSGARKWLVGLRFSAIPSEGADGSRGIFFKEFNAPTAIHWLPPRASDHEHLRRRLPCEPRPHRGGDRGAKRPTSFVAEVMRAAKKAGHVGRTFTQSGRRQGVIVLWFGRGAAVSLVSRASSRRVTGTA